MTSQKQRLPYHLLRILAGWLLCAIIIAAFAISGVRMSRLSRDPAELADIPIYYGLLSNFGILIWAAAAFISFFASFHVQGAKRRSLLCWSGILTTVLLLDDFFLVHDVIFPDVLGLPQWLIYPCYMIAFPLFFVSHLKTIIADTEYHVLA